MTKRKKTNPIVPIEGDNRLDRLPDGTRLEWVPNWYADDPERFHQVLQYAPEDIEANRPLRFWHTWCHKRLKKMVRCELQPFVDGSERGEHFLHPRRRISFSHNGKNVMEYCYYLTVVAKTGFAIPDRRHNVVDHKVRSDDDRPIAIRAVTQRENCHSSRLYWASQRLSNANRVKAKQARIAKLKLQIAATMGPFPDANDVEWELAMQLNNE